MELAVVPRAGRWMWTPAGRPALTLLTPRRAVPPGATVSPSRTVQTPYGERIVVVRGIARRC